MPKYQPFILLGPGDTIREELEYYGWTQQDLAEITGLSSKHISQLVSNKTPITFEMACILGDVFKQSPQFWLNADARYRLALQESATSERTAARTLIYRYMPVRDMRRKGMLPDDVEALVPAVLDFWGLDRLGFDFIEKQAACFRKTRTRSQFNPYFALTWLRAVRNQLGSWPLPSQSFDAEYLSSLAEHLPSWTTRDDGVALFLSELTHCGVLFLHVPQLEKTYTDGAVFWHGDSPVLAYTCRYDRNDNFWFTIAHEIGHILRHHDHESPVFIDSLDHLDMEDRREEEADEFARRHLRIPEILRYFQDARRISRKRVEECAQIMGVHSAIVVGTLQHHDRLAYQALQDTKTPIREQLPRTPWKAHKCQAEACSE